MRNSILGFNQERAIQANLDLTDLVLLQYIMQANGNPEMKHIVKDEVSYVWLYHKKIQEDLPILNIAEKTLRNRLSILKNNSWLDSVAVRTSTGTNTYYSLSTKAMSLINDKGEPCPVDGTCPCPVDGTSDNKLIDNKLIDKSTNVDLYKPTEPKSDDVSTHSASRARNAGLKMLIAENANNKNFKNEKNSEKNLNIEKNRGKKNLYERCTEAIENFTEDFACKNLLTTYLRVRLEMRQYPLYFNQWVGYLNELKRLEADGQDIQEVIQQSINRGYKGFYVVKKYNTQSRQQDKSVFSEYGQVKSVRSDEVAMNVQF